MARQPRLRRAASQLSRLHRLWPEIHAGKLQRVGRQDARRFDHGVNWLIAKGIADPARIAIMGGSYGGYAALVGLTLTPEVFAVGVSSVGISNLISHYNNYPPYWSLSKPRFRARVGDPQKDEELLKA